MQVALCTCQILHENVYIKLWANSEILVFGYRWPLFQLFTEVSIVKYLIKFMLFYAVLKPLYPFGTGKKKFTDLQIIYRVYSV